ncbi:MAG: arsenical resistance protein ArsH [Pseudomonadota bacterium]|nr:arsenical resistance protein ArsH [Pseudomonadota bacterium]
MQFPTHSVATTFESLTLGEQRHPPKILILYGSLREGSYSKKLALLCKDLLLHFGAEVKIFDPSDLPVFDRQNFDHPAVKQLRELSIWSEAQVWISPEQHGAMTAAFKNQIDWLPLSDGAVRPTQGRCLALLQVCGGSQSFNAVNQMRILGRWMRMFTIPNQSSIPMAWKEFDEGGQMKDSSYKERVYDVMEELFRFTLLLRENVGTLTTRYSEQKQLAEAGQLKAGLGVKSTSQNND